MKKTFVTNMPNHIGAFLKASKCFAELGVNITRVSYNKAVDSHTLFIDVEGDEINLSKASDKLKEIGYLSTGEDNVKIVLIEFRLEDKPGSVTGILELISRFNFNISYMSSQENGSGYQLFKMGLYVNCGDCIKSFLLEAEKLCELRVINYNDTEKVFDNSIFYNSYVNGLVKLAGLSAESKEELLVSVNLAMQTLDEQGLSPYKTFDSISKFAELLKECKGENFKPRITRHEISPKTTITLIEPDCGSNTAVIESDGERLFVDTGYACYKSEMQKVINELYPSVNLQEETVLLTHADLDHCGLVNEFGKAILSRRSAESLMLEANNLDGYREKNPLHKPYINICKILTGYKPANVEKLCPSWRKASGENTLEEIGRLKVGEFNFIVYEGAGGHLAGEVLLLDFNMRVAFTGDVFINVYDLTKKQAEYNKYAPILMTSVDTNPKTCSAERFEFLQTLSSGTWQIFGGHGQKKIYEQK